MPHRVLREGRILGVVGASSVAVWFFLVDAIQRHPFQTPITLGRAFFTLFHQTVDGSTDLLVVIGYTVFHFLAFIAVGVVIAAVVSWSRRQPTVLAGGLILFVVLEAAFYGLLYAFVQIPMSGVFAWYNVAVGNLIAALAMGAYLQRAHPHLAADLMHALGGEE